MYRGVYTAEIGARAATAAKKGEMNINQFEPNITKEKGRL
jgi:hypothetical protein